MHIGLIIKELRLKKGKSQRQMAKETDIDNSSISAWEKGTYEPTAENNLVICEYFGLEPHTLGKMVEDEQKKSDTKVSDEIAVTAFMGFVLDRLASLEAKVYNSTSADAIRELTQSLRQAEQTLLQRLKG